VAIAVPGTERPGEPTPATAVDIANKFAVNEMSPDDSKRAYRKDMMFAAAMVATGIVISGVSLAQLKSSKQDPQMAQATQPLQASPTPTPTPQASPPAESKPGGDRPTTPAPEPARPDADAQKARAQPALPPAPAEKSAPPIKER
jgi:hypothetical protein